MEPAARARLTDLALLVSRWAGRMNLTGHREASAVLESLVLDALALWKSIRPLLEGRAMPRLVDLGSGAGFPGLPIAIVEPGICVDLVESRQRRHHFQRAACRELALRNVTPRLGRIEALAPSPADLVVAQAVGPIREVVSLARRWVLPGGWLAIPCGPTPPEPEAGAEWGCAGARAYAAPGGTPHTVWTARRTG